MNPKSIIHKFIKKRNCTLLGIGPMSKNCIDASIQLSNEHEVPLMLIASRRQIDSKQFGGGYVENWTTKEFADYVKNKDMGQNIILARDHGGPWQNDIEKEKKMPLKDAMQSCKDSFRADIDAGLGMLHIDPSIDIHSKPTIDQTLERLFELYEFCWDYSSKKGKKIIFEIGTEEQSGGNNSKEELEYTLDKVKKFCDKNKIPFPSFIVIQTGTRVMEMRNIGSFDSPIRIANELPPEIQIPKMIEICKKYDIFMKEHNTDYLSSDSLMWHPRLGIHAANVAPEFGVCETKTIVNTLKITNNQDLLDKFLEIAFNSGKWHKWMLNDSKSSYIEKSIIAGHYIFSSDSFLELKSEMNYRIKGFDKILIESIKKSILRYMNAFNLTSINK